MILYGFCFFVVTLMIWVNLTDAHGSYSKNIHHYDSSSSLSSSSSSLRVDDFIVEGVGAPTKKRFSHDSETWTAFVTGPMKTNYHRHNPNGGASHNPFLIHPTLTMTTQSSSRACQPRPTFSDISSTSYQPHQGLYRPFVEYAFQKLQESGHFAPETNFPPLELSRNESPAKGMPPGSMVRMETKALVPSLCCNNNKNNNQNEKIDKKSPIISYARYALLETIVPVTTTTKDEKEEDKEQVQDESDCSSTTTSTAGIQVLNLVVFPSSKTPLPVWGVDLVSLPGNRHLLAMDAQPMTSPSLLPPSSIFLEKGEEKLVGSSGWQSWHDTHVKDVFAWGGDIPEEASDFFSSHALWTRLQGGENATTIIQTKVWDAFCDHLDLYLEMLDTCYNLDDIVTNNNNKKYMSPSSSSPPQEEIDTVYSYNKEINWQERYLDYRLKNDPARPMLTSLYGKEWTERVLNEVLFPKYMIQK